MKVRVGVSARHVHVTKEDVKILFGEDYSLTKKVDLSQPGQYACNEQVTIKGPKGIYSLPFFFLDSNNITLMTAPNKNDSTESIIVFINPNASPNPVISFTSPYPIASLPAINPPTRVIIKNTPPPNSKPYILSKNKLKFVKPNIKVKTKDTSNIVSESLFGIICFL